MSEIAYLPLFSILICVDSNFINTISGIGTAIAGISSICLILYYWFEYCLKEKTKKFYLIREKLVELKRLLNNINDYTNVGPLSILAEELMIELFCNIERINEPDTIPDILTSDNRFYLNNIINTVLERNYTIQEQSEDIKRIMSIMNDISHTFPTYTLTLNLVTNLLLYYTEQKTSTQQIIYVLYNGQVQQHIFTPQTSDIRIPYITQVKALLAHYLLGTTVLLDIPTRTIMTKDISDALILVSKGLLDGYISLDDNTLERISEKQKGEEQSLEQNYQYRGSSTFVQDFSDVFIRIQKDFEPTMRWHIAELMRTVDQLFLRNRNLR